MDVYLPLQAVRAGRVANLQEASGGGPSGWVLPGWRLLCLNPGLDVAERTIDGDEGGVAAATDVEGHI